jgi:transitional endoplasmic reticulum ATPase
MSEQSGVRLKVARPQQQDVGKGLVRLPVETLEALSLEQGGVVEVRGKRATAATALAAHPEDAGIDVVRMDGLLRSNAGVGIGETVELAPAEWRPAERILLAPATEGVHLQGDGAGLLPTLVHRPLVKGDVVSTSVARRPPNVSPDAMPPQVAARAFGLMEIRLVVAETQPKGLVRVTGETEIELLPELAEAERLATPPVTYEDLGGMGGAVQSVREMIELPLKHPELFDRLGITPPKGVLLHGPPGTGKTLLAKAVASETDARFLTINGPEILGGGYGETESRLRELFEQAEKSAPSILFIDELDSLAPKRAQSSEMERRLVAQLLTLMDGMRADRKVVVIGATNRIDAIDEALRRPGRFDREVEIGIPDRDGRFEILQVHTRGMPLADDVDVEELASTTHGFTGSDIAALVREAAMATLRRIFPDLDPDEPAISPEILEGLEVTNADFEEGLKEVQPSALREILVQVPDISWENVGGLDEVKGKLRELVELPLEKPEIFTRLGIQAPKGVLLYGPPGTGKTLLAKAVANEVGANFLTAKGSTLLSKWYGESEQKVAAFFRRARQAAPAVLFFDELDSLAPVRGGGMGTHEATERVVNQFLAELDGMEELRGVAIIGATNRPDRIDPALLRPGRFDEMVYVPVPDAAAREEILRALTRTMTLAEDVDLGQLAELSEGFTGADLRAACTKAGLLAIRENPDARAVGREHFLLAMKETLPSVTDQTQSEYEQVARRVKQQHARIGFHVEE